MSIALLPRDPDLPLGDEIAQLAAQLDAATHRLLTCIRRFDETEEWHQQGAQSCAHWLSWRIGLDGATARERVRVARALGKLPVMDDQLSRGQLSYAKVRAMTRVATPANEARLCELAAATTGAQLERICRRFRRADAELNEESVAPERCVRVRPLKGGLVRLEVTMNPDEVELVLKAIEKARDELRPARDVSGETPALPSRTDGLVHIAQQHLTPTTTSSTPGHHQVFIHLDRSLLNPNEPWEAFLDDGTRVSAETFRRVCCDSSLVGALSDDKGDLLAVGRRTRVIPPAIRRALWLRDRGCRFPGCNNRRFIHGHHIKHWAHGGETSVKNLVLLCSFHHQLVHEGGFTVRRTASGELQFLDRRRSPVAEVPQGAVSNDNAIGSAPLSDTHPVLCAWDGEPIDYESVLDSLIEEAG